MKNNEEKRRAEYAVLKYRSFLRGIILDVGCRDRHAEKYLKGNFKYVGIDISGKPDVIVDLENQKIPFQDNYFDAVICLDVLEHLNNIQDVFDELLRVSKRYVVISLPNCYPSILFNVISGREKTKHYGLPIESKKDRHKWFFNYKEAKEFIMKKAEKNGAKVIDIHPFIKNRPLRNFIFKILFRKNYENIAALCIFALIEK